MYHNLSIQLLKDLLVLAIMNKAIKNLCVQILWGHKFSTPLSLSLGAGSLSNSPIPDVPFADVSPVCSSPSHALDSIFCRG